jgi:hypothetical protein
MPSSTGSERPLLSRRDFVRQAGFDRPGPRPGRQLGRALRAGPREGHGVTSSRTTGLRTIRDGFGEPSYASNPHQPQQAVMPG